LPPDATLNGNRFRPAWDAALALADGTIFHGRGFGADVDADGEVVFTTSMTGYQEVCTDPSFAGQIVCMTYPLIGNYGVNAADAESRRPWISGLIVRELCDLPSNWRSEGTLDAYLHENQIPGIYGIDTRALTRHIRTSGDIRGVLVRNAKSISDDELVERAKSARLPGDWDVVGLVGQDGPQRFGAGDGPHIVIVDCGVKLNIVQSLIDRGAVVSVVPYGTPFGDIQALKPDGIVVSPGPGDPSNLDSGLDVVRATLDADVPYFGICLGHQLLARAIGADTGKLKFGHRGGNHPVKDLRTGQVSITAQNHGFYVDGATLPVTKDWEVALVNLNDRSVEGLRHATLPIISVQFHPEASPGPWDSGNLFDDFLDMVRARKAA
jgi:carbamoyl-phosphate synthase small subunit